MLDLFDRCKPGKSTATTGCCFSATRERSLNCANPAKTGAFLDLDQQKTLWHHDCVILREITLTFEIGFQMHASQLAELGGWLTLQSQTINHEELALLLSDRYWSVSKCRSQRWNNALRLFAQDLQSEKPHNPWPAISIVTEEIIFSELLTRIWSAVLTQNSDQSESAKDVFAIAHGILIAHVESRSRAFKLLLKIPESAEPVAEKLNQLRRSIERWTDLLLSQLPNHEAARTFAFCEKRFNDFASNDKVADDVKRQAQKLLASSLSEDLERLASRFPANPEMNRKIADGILACLPKDSFALTELPKSIWMLQVQSYQKNTEDLVQQLIDGHQIEHVNV